MKKFLTFFTPRTAVLTALILDAPGVFLRLGALLSLLTPIPPFPSSRGVALVQAVGVSVLWVAVTAVFPAIALVLCGTALPHLQKKDRLFGRVMTGISIILLFLYVMSLLTHFPENFRSSTILL